MSVTKTKSGQQAGTTVLCSAIFHVVGQLPRSGEDLTQGKNQTRPFNLRHWPAGYIKGVDWVKPLLTLVFLVEIHASFKSLKEKNIFLL